VQVTRDHVLRELAWCIVAYTHVLLVAALTPIGSFLLRFEWFSGMFRIPHEEVLLPVFIAGGLVVPLGFAIVLIWLTSRFLPGAHSRGVMFARYAVASAVAALVFSRLFPIITLEPGHLPVHTTVAISVLVFAITVSARLLVRARPAARWRAA
jgi:hypothetical protein